MNYKSIFVAAILLFLSSANFSVQAQRHQSSKFRNVSYNYFKNADKITLIAGTGLSVMNSDNRSKAYRSDINHIKGNGYGPNVSLGAMYQLSPFFGVLGTVEYVGFTGYQDVGVETSGQGVSFRSDAFSASGSVVLNLARKYVLSSLLRTRFIKGVVVPYVKAGVGYMHYSASSSSEGRQGELTPETEYPAIATVIPVGGGFRIRYSKQISFAPELTFNFTSTDYLDNTAQAGGYTGNNDNFVNASIRVMYTPSAKRSFDFVERR